MDKTVIQHIEHSNGTLFSFELLPPLKGQDFVKVLLIVCIILGVNSVLKSALIPCC